VLSKLRQLLSPKSFSEKLRLGQAAEAWAGDEVLDTALAKQRDTVIHQWIGSRDPETRERAWLLMQAINTHAAALAEIVLEAENARAERAHDERRDKKSK